MSERNFLTVNNPAQWKSHDAQALVRANATRSQHQRRREKDIFRHGTWPRPPKPEYRLKNVKTEPDLDESTNIPSQEKFPEPSSVESIDSERGYATGARAFQTVLLHDSDNTVGQCLVNLGTHPGVVLAQFADLFRLHAPDFNQRFSRYGFHSTKLCSSFYPFIFTDAAPMAAALLMGVLYILNGRREPLARNPIVLRLRSFVVLKIQSALSENLDYAISDQIIAAVIMMAKCDAMYFLQESHAAHMSGLIRMLRLRGGYTMLGLDGILRCIVLWFDSASADILGTNLYCDHNDIQGWSSVPVSCAVTFGSA